MIAIDTAIMRELVTASTTANNKITEAMDVLNLISIHNDWACKEKDAINEYTKANRNRIQQLQENSSAFLNAITGAAAEFEQTETSISDMFSSVESILSNILSITSNIIGTIGGTQSFGTGFSQQVTVLQEYLDSVNEVPNPFDAIAASVIQDYLPNSVLGGVNPFESFVANNLSEALTICRFTDIDLG